MYPSCVSVQSTVITAAIVKKLASELRPDGLLGFRHRPPRRVSRSLVRVRQQRLIERRRAYRLQAVAAVPRPLPVFVPDEALEQTLMADLRARFNETPFPGAPFHWYREREAALRATQEGQAAAGPGRSDPGAAE